MAGCRPILCVGAAHWDLIARAATPLGPGADLPGRIARQPGGVALNVALALAALGRPVALLSAIGRDLAGDSLLVEASARGVVTAHVTRVEGPSDGYVAIEGPDGEIFAAVADCRALEAAGTTPLGPLRDGALAEPGAPWTSGVVVDGNLPEAALIEIARLVAGNLAIVPASPGKAARLAPLLGRAAATLYVNRREAEEMLGVALPDSRAAAAGLRARGAREVVVTDGAAPATQASAAGIVTVAPPHVATRSLTGAGDRFLAAHLAARADGLAPEAALRAAVAASAAHISAEVP